MKPRSMAVVLALTVFILVAATCDGSPNQSPVADAGGDLDAAQGNVVMLDGSGSHDADGDLLTYRWSFTATPVGSNASLADASKVVASFTPDIVGEYEVELAVSDGISEARDQVVVRVVNAPVADAGPDRTVQVGESVLLDGGGSIDPSGDDLAYTWTLDELPGGSGAVLTGANTPEATFVPDVAGIYKAVLAVSNGSASASDEVTVTAVQSGNRPPVADAGPDQTVTAGETVYVDGAGSSDPDGDPISYSWSILTWPERTTQPAPDLSNPSAASPEFTASASGSYTLELTVDDGALTDADRVTITAESATPAGTIYVSTTGSDAQRGTEAEPLQTLGKALMMAHEHSSVTAIFLSNGTYMTGESFAYVVTRDLFIEGESQGGVVLAAGDKDVFTVEQPDGASEAVRLFLTDLTLETTGTGVRLPANTEANLTRVTCLGADPCAVAADIVGWFPVPGGTLTIRDSVLTGPGTGNGLNILGGGHLIQNTTIENYDDGIDALGASFQVLGGTFSGNARGLYLEGTLDGNLVRVSGTTFDDNGYGIYVDDVALSAKDVDITNSGTYGVYLLGDQEVDLTNVTVVGSGSVGVRAEGPLVSVQGGSFSENAYGLMIGSSTASIQDILAHDNSTTGLVLLGDATVTLRDSELRNNDLFNVQILGSPTAVDLGVQGDPGNNVFELGSSTWWSLTDQRPDLASANGVVVTLYGNWFVADGIARSYDPALDIVTGPDSRNNDWRITGTNQRLRF